MLSAEPARPASPGGRFVRFLRWFGPDPRYERWRLQIWGITWLAYAGFLLTRKSFPVAKVGIGEGTAIGMSEIQMAWVDGAFLIAYAIGQLFWGIAGDRFGTRKVILIGMLASVVTTAAMGFASSAAAFGILFFIQGVCQSSGWPPLLKNIGEFFSRRERGFVLGLWCTNYAVGGLLASVLAGLAAGLYGWRFAFFVPAAVLLGIWFLFLLLQRDRPEDAGLPPIESYHNEPVSLVKAGDLPQEEQEGSWKLIRDVLSRPVILLLAMAYFFLKPARYTLLFWAPKYISDRLGANITESAFLSGAFELSGPFSILLAGWVSDRFFRSRRIPIAILCLVLLAGVLVVLDHLPRNRWMLAVSLSVAGFLVYAPDMLLAGVAAVDFGTKKGASTASGLINAFGSSGAVIGAMLPGLLLRQWGWNGVFVLLAGSVIVSVLLLAPKWNATPPEAK